ncbi:MAG: Smr/MutS family protein [Clostridia bacterium]|nr:Smr/MutS family protein [Clostridia bacterium]
MRYKILNLKENQPTVELALAILEIEVEMARREGYYAMKVIHGYGSHGVGGAIKKALNFWLMSAKKRGFIRDYVKGEHWLASQTAEKIKKQCPEVIGDPELYFSNSGITIIQL